MSFGQSKNQAPVGNTPDIQTGPFGPVQGPFFQPQATYSGVSPSWLPIASGSMQAPDFSQALKAFNVPSKGGAPIGTGDIPSGLTASISGGGTVSGGGWQSGIGTEFGEIDNPVYGGYTEAGWNKGAWGDNLAGWDTKGVALPNVPRGTLVQVQNPTTGQSTYATVLDKGPGAQTGASIDLLGGTRAALGLPRNFKGPVQFRIVGGPGTQIPTGTQPQAPPALAQAPPQAATPQKQKPSPQKPAKKKPPQITRGRRIAYSFGDQPAALQFLRQTIAPLPYAEGTPQAAPSEEET